jgi:hypothetical protein
MSSKYFVLLAKLVATLAATYAVTLVVMFVALAITASVNHISTLDAIVDIVHMFGVK